MQRPRQGRELSEKEELHSCEDGALDGRNASWRVTRPTVQITDQGLFCELWRQKGLKGVKSGEPSKVSSEQWPPFPQAEATVGGKTSAVFQRPWDSGAQHYRLGV
jgi:hypothetical protein